MLLARVQAQGKNKNVIRNTGSKLMSILLHLVMKTLLKRQINLESMFRRRTHLEIVFIKTSPILITLNRKHCLQHRMNFAGIQLIQLRLSFQNLKL
jgi:hypothetical protein